MELETAERISHLDATEDEIRAAFADDQGRGEFIILSQSDQVYLQAAGEGDGPYLLEYREGDDLSHYQCEREVSKAQAEQTFLLYLRGDRTWKSALPWARVELRNWGRPRRAESALSGRSGHARLMAVLRVTRAAGIVVGVLAGLLLLYGCQYQTSLHDGRQFELRLVSNHVVVFWGPATSWSSLFELTWERRRDSTDPALLFAPRSQSAVRSIHVPLWLVLGAAVGAALLLGRAVKTMPPAG